MSLLTSAIGFVERTPMPDPITRAGIAFLVGRTEKALRHASGGDAGFARGMVDHPIAEHTDAANEQHYELPPRFFELTLGPRRKYSACLYPTGRESLAEAEMIALDETMAHAGLADGQQVLELGCGWGSLSLSMAAAYPHSTIVSVSNSAPQRVYIEARAAAAGLGNLTVITADMNDFAPAQNVQFDRVVSVEMFEHMANWRGLLERVRGWLKPDGALFLHVFAHKHAPYRFDRADPTDWIAQHFFTGGIMPNHGLVGQFPDCFTVERQWWWDGHHYARTARDWLANFDANIVEIDVVLRDIYGKDAALWRRRWRLFYLATAGLFGHGDGETWGVSHGLLRPVI